MSRGAVAGLPSAGRRVLTGWALGFLWSALTALPAAAGHGGDSTVLTLRAEHVRRLIEGGQPLTIVDLRPVDEYRKGHLPRARSVPLSELPRRFQEIPKTELVVLYCACPLGEIQGGYLFLRDQSYRNIIVMEEGFTLWVKKGYPVER